MSRLSVALEEATTRAEDAIRTGDEQAFAALAERYRRQLHVHCYRVLGSFDEAEDMVQETLLRAWRARSSFDGRSLFRTWLYRIATNTCLNALERAQRRILPQDVAEPITAASDASNAPSEPAWQPELPWLQPYPDVLLDRETEPDAIVVSRETIELAYLAALQHLPPRQRAILILRDALGWSANEVAGMLALTTTAVNSALQRARSTMRLRMPSAREEWAPAKPSTGDEQSALRKFMEAWERSDTNLLTSLLREDARWSMPPAPLWFDGRSAIVRLFELFPISTSGEFRMLPIGANRQPATAVYIRHPGTDVYRFAGVQVLRVVAGQIAENIAFSEVLCRQFDLPPVMSSAHLAC